MSAPLSIAASVLFHTFSIRSSAIRRVSIQTSLVFSMKWLDFCQAGSRNVLTSENDGPETLLYFHTSPSVVIMFRPYRFRLSYISSSLGKQRVVEKSFTTI